jgi:hypothetical protein
MIGRRALTLLNVFPLLMLGNKSGYVADDQYGRQLD